MKKRNKKGQVALESIFVILFIIVAMARILAQVLEYTNEIGSMANERAKCQGFALERSLKGITTHLIRIDLNTASGAIGFDVYFFSTDCSQPSFNNELGSFPGIDTAKYSLIDCEDNV